MSPQAFLIVIFVLVVTYHWGKAVEREQQCDRNRHRAAQDRADEDEVDILLTQHRMAQLDQGYAQGQRIQPPLNLRERPARGEHLRLVYSGIPGTAGVGDSGEAGSRARHPAGSARWGVWEQDPAGPAT